MPQTLKINNYPSINLVEPTVLDADTPALATSLTVKNNQGYSATDYFFIGTPGNENGELLIVQSLTGATGITSTTGTKFPHYRFDPINKLFGNKIRIYTAPNVNGIAPDDSAFSILTTVDIDPDQIATSYTDPSGDATKWYKHTYYNSTTTAETNLSDSTAARGGGNSGYCSIDDIREEAGFTGARYITDAMIDAKRQMAQAEINSALTGTYPIPFTAPINPLIADIARRLAAGYLLLEQYGAFGTQNSANGQNKVDNAMKDLERLQKGGLTLTDQAGNNTVISDAGGFNAWPNGDTAQTDTEYGGAPRNFRMGDVQGYYGRKY